MDTKLKNSRNVRIGIIIIGLLLAVGVNVSLFPWMIRNAEQKSAQLFSSSENVNTEYIDTLYQGAYVLYTEIKNEPSENRTEPFVGEGSGYDDYDYISEWSSSFEGVRSETDYYATDGAKKEVNVNNKEKLSREEKNRISELTMIKNSGTLMRAFLSWTLTKMETCPSMSKRMEQFLRIHSSKVFYRQTDTMKYAHMRWTMIRRLSR